MSYLVWNEVFAVASKTVYWSPGRVCMDVIQEIDAQTGLSPGIPTNVLLPMEFSFD